MKELIEKIKEIYDSLAMDTFDDADKLEYFKNRILNDLSNIQEQENKPFNPLELGFTKEYESDSESVFYKTSNNRIIFDKINKLYNFDIYKFNRYSEVKRIRIKNHRQGKELLENLGAIE